MQIVNNRGNNVQEERDTWEITVLYVYFYCKLKTDLTKKKRKNNCHARILFPAKYFSRMRVKERLFF